MPIIDDDAFIHDYVAGNDSVADLCDKYGINYSGVYYRLKKYGIKPRRPYRNGRAMPTDEDRQNAVAEYVTGIGSTVLANKYGVNSSTIINWVRAAGEDVRPSGRREGSVGDIRDANTVRVEYENGVEASVLADKYKVTTSTIYAWIRRAGGDPNVAPCATPYPYSERLYENENGYLERVLHPDYWLFDSGVSKRKTFSHVRMLEHRRVMAEHLGRPLSSNETVHHIDGNRANNDLSNLQLRQGRHGPGQAWQCRNCGSIDIEAIEI